MSFDLNAKSSQLLERLANSIHDRDKNNILNQNFCFSLAEIHIVENWLKEVLNEYLQAFADD